jgi:hypothetical protein
MSFIYVFIAMLSLFYWIFDEVSFTGSGQQKVLFTGSYALAKFLLLVFNF